MLLLILIVITSFTVFLFSQSESKEGYIFLVAPSAILMANACETSKFSWATDLMILALFIVAVLQIPFNIS